MTDEILMNPEQQAAADKQLQATARDAARRWGTLHRPGGRSEFPHRVLAAGNALQALRARVDAAPARPGDATEPFLDLRENMRLLEAAYEEARGSAKIFDRLPRLAGEHDNEHLRAFAAAVSLLRATGMVWDHRALTTFLEAAQGEQPLTLEEIWAFPTLMKFALLEHVLAEAQGLPEQADTVRPRIRRAAKSLRELGFADWPSLAEPLVMFDSTLRKDPAGAYARMTFDTRELYRRKVAKLSRYGDCSEDEVASQALKLAELAGAGRPEEDARVALRRRHVGYYLIDAGADELAEKVGYHPPFLERLRMTARRDADLFYIAPIEVLSLLLIAAFLLPLIPGEPSILGVLLACLFLVLPATQGVVDLINNVVTTLFEAQPLAKLDLRKGVPREFTTLVAVPTLLLSEKQLRELVNELEVRYLANQDPHIHFGLITDLPDSVTRPRENDTDPLVDLAVRLIDELNARYAEAQRSGRGGVFVLFHRHRIFNARQGVWMGWERKRGKLLDLNKYLRGVFDAFPVKAGNLHAVLDAKYIITLDSDTQLPRGTAAAMIGAMAHPLNRAVIDPQTRIVTTGYGILQPRVGVSVQSASRSRLASLYSGQTGYDIYTRAVSDVYQDLYGEGIFTGKGIYEVETLHRVLDRRFPRNALLSHDLIEGAYARAGLTTDIEVIDDYPSHYSAYTRRKHRWVRGDWQIAQWLFASVPDESRRSVRNPISTISRWKIFDNLRRSLVDPFTLMLFVAGWLGLRGGARYWTFVTLLLMFLPTLVQLVFSLGRALASDIPGAVKDAWTGFLQACFLTLLNLVFLPHSTLLSLDAIVRALIRRFVTGQKLLEWETAAEAESGARKTPVDRYLLWTPVFALIVGLLVFLLRPRALPVALPVLVLWGCAGVLTAWLNRPPREDHRELYPAEGTLLREHALRIWRYFYQFSTPRHHYLIPDNVEEQGLFEAARVSPTNVGLLLNARQAAVEFGFLSVPEFTALTRETLATMDKLPKHRGHLYNWYNTETLEPLGAITVSSVDSGNLAASLYTLRTGAAELLGRPLVNTALLDGLDTVAAMAGAKSTRERRGARTPDEVLAELDLRLAEVLRAAEPPAADGWWAGETRLRYAAVRELVESYMPWLLPEFAELRPVGGLGLKDGDAYPKLRDAATYASNLDECLARTWATATVEDQVVLSERLRGLLPAALARCEDLAREVERCSAEAMRLATEMDFAFLVQEDRQMLSIGWEEASGKLHDATYDMLASEARIAAFLAVAKGEMSQESWFKMGRTHTMAYGRAVLLSWTGTMFEYLMPSLWMRSYPETLMARTLGGVVAIQREFARGLGLPWGVSESGFAETDPEGHYHYFAWGVPQIALKWDADAGPVIAPYASYLALGVDPDAAIANIQRMLKAGWMGDYGLYEAVDYIKDRKQPKLVREWMAHHQGMALMALLNLLHAGAAQRWFHANPHLQATELLLHEKPIRKAVLKRELSARPPKKPLPAAAAML